MSVQNLKEELFYQLNIEWYKLLCGQIIFIVPERNLGATCTWELNETKNMAANFLTMKYNCWKVWRSADTKDLCDVRVPTEHIT